MVGELFPLHNLEILGDILINFEPLSTFINILEEGSTKKIKTNKQIHEQTLYNALQLNQHNPAKTTTYIYNVKLPLFSSTQKCDHFCIKTSSTLVHLCGVVAYNFKKHRYFGHYG